MTNPNTNHTWTAADYDPETHSVGCARPMSRLNHPRPGGSPSEQRAFVMLAIMLNGGEADPESTALIGPQFLCATWDLQRLGWPIIVQRRPLRAKWVDVPDDIVAAWARTFGVRGSELIAGLESVSLWRPAEKRVMFAS